jgi:hypothetical protein
VPYIGFGLVDNSMMVISGEVRAVACGRACRVPLLPSAAGPAQAIDNTLGVMLGTSALAAAALGNSFSNGLGMVLHGTIERFAGALGLPDPRLTVHQRASATVKNVRMAAGIFGVLCGCLLGMCAASERI